MAFQARSSIPPSDDKSISLLIKQKEERKVEEEMKSKQREFSERMESCVFRRNQLKKKKEKVTYPTYDNILFITNTLHGLQLEHHIESFRHILQDSEIRKFRATQKISSESKEIFQKTQEVNTLSCELHQSTAM